MRQMSTQNNLLNQRRNREGKGKSMKAISEPASAVLLLRSETNRANTKAIENTRLRATIQEAGSRIARLERELKAARDSRWMDKYQKSVERQTELKSALKGVYSVLRLEDPVAYHRVESFLEGAISQNERIAAINEHTFTRVNLSTAAPHSETTKGMTYECS